MGSGAQGPLWRWSVRRETLGRPASSYAGFRPGQLPADEEQVEEDNLEEFQAVRVDPPEGRVREHVGKGHRPKQADDARAYGLDPERPRGELGHDDRNGKDQGPAVCNSYCGPAQNE